MIFWCEKIRKLRMIFDIIWKSVLSTFWRPMWTSVKIKSKKYFPSNDFFAKMKPLLTHVRKTIPLRSHYYPYFRASATQKRQGNTLGHQLWHLQNQQLPAQQHKGNYKIFRLWLFHWLKRKWVKFEVSSEGHRNSH